MLNTKRIFTSVIGAGVILILTGCGAAERRQTPAMVPSTPVQQYTEPEEQYDNPGSLFSASEATDLYADNRAHRVGDIVLINIVENSKSKSKADTTASKATTNQYGVAAAFGRNSVGLLGPAGGPLSGSVGVSPILSTSTSSSFSATGETKRENYVTATIGARVLQVLPGGVLQVQGAREVKVNNETQYMIVSGLVRSKDIGQDNSVLSTQMADSKIAYVGEGVLGDKQKPGWMTRLLDNIWPF